MKDIRIAVIDDHDLFREGIKLVLNQVEGFNVVFDTPDGNQFIGNIADIQPDIVLMDIDMPVISGVVATEKALKINPDLKIAALSMFSDTGHYTQMINAGVKGFILKKANKFELEQAIRTIWNGGNYFSQEILQKLAFHFTERPNDREHLTGREIEIIVMICQGMTSQEISDKLFISNKTVETHRSNIFLKTGVKNVAGLIIWAIKNQYYFIK